MSSVVALEPLPIDVACGRDRSAPSRAPRDRDYRRARGRKDDACPAGAGDDGPVIVLQPRRVAARSMARRIAAERGWTLGAEAGWHVRFDRQFSPARASSSRPKGS